MFRASTIQNGEPIKVPTPSWERRTFSSNVTGRSIVCSEPREFRMGATAWKLEVFDNDSNVTKSHPNIAEVSKAGGFLLPTNFQPWSPDGNLFLIPTWKAHHFIYNISKGNAVKSEIDGLVDILLWSPSTQNYFASVFRYAPNHSREHFVVSKDGHSKYQIDITPLLDEPAYCWWLKDGTAFISLYRSSKQSHPIIELFDSNSGQSIGKISANPNQLIPWQELQHQDISRDHYSLELSPSIHCVGYLLDTWHKCHFDCTTNQLSLAVYRPVGEKIIRKNGTVLPVEEKWCKLQLEF